METERNMAMPETDGEPAETGRAGAGIEKAPGVQQAAGTPGSLPVEMAVSEEAARIEAQRKEIETQREELQREYLRIDTRRILAENGLPGELLENVMGNDLEGTVKTVRALKEVFDNAVQKQVEIRLRGRTPQSGNGDCYDMEQGLSAQVRRALW